MERLRNGKLLDYLPIIAFLGYWLYGGLIGALVTGEARLMMLGFVTVPVVGAMLAAAFKLHKIHQANDK